MHPARRLDVAVVNRPGRDRVNETRAITLHQPWASLVALGIKTIETRSWPTKYRGRLLIHAATRPIRDTPVERGRIGDSEYSVRLVGRYGAVIEGPGIRPWDLTAGIGRQGGVPMPLGAVVATAMLHAICPMVDVLTGEGPAGQDWYSHALYITRHADPELAIVDRWADLNDPRREVDVSDQVPFGEFTPGRWAWLLSDVKPTTERCPRCWGPGATHPDGWDGLRECRTCDGRGHCDPVPMRGRQGLWTPSEEDWAPASDHVGTPKAV